MRTVWPALFAVLVIAAVGPQCGSAASPTNPGLRVGIVANTLDWGTQTARMQRASRDIGARWLREDLRWNEIEPVRGARRWARFDRVFASAARERMHVLPVLYLTPRWLAKDPTTLPRDPRRFAAFARDAVLRYGPGGAFWKQHPELDDQYAPRWFELWNEPYLPQFAGGAPNPGTYAHLVAAAGAAIHAANPSARVLAAAETTWDGPTGDQSWLKDMHAAVDDLGTFYDGASVHPYTRGSPISATLGAERDFRRLDAIRSELQEVGGPADQLWITEIGWPTCSLRPECVSEQQQARYLKDVFRLVRTRYPKVVRAVIVYALRDLGRSPGVELREAYFGLVTRGDRRKPAAAVLKATTG